MDVPGEPHRRRPILQRYRRDPDAIEIEVIVSGIGEQAPMLRDGRADVAFLTAPYDDLAGFDTEPLLNRDQVAVLPRAHRLADRAALTLADLAGEQLPRWPGDDVQATTVVVAWPERTTSRAVAALIRASVEAADGSCSGVAAVHPTVISRSR
jgi:DNA-binding transcriptional LysR family regulator